MTMVTVELLGGPGCGYMRRANLSAPPLSCDIVPEQEMGDPRAQWAHYDLWDFDGVRARYVYTERIYLGICERVRLPELLDAVETIEARGRAR